MFRALRAETEKYKSERPVKIVARLWRLEIRGTENPNR
jgi:hypothetical protein